MRAASPVRFLGFACCVIVCSPAHGIGFGRVASSTLLGQPLEFTAVVNLESDESVTRECVFAEVVAGDIRVAPGFVRVSLESGASERERIVRVSTSTPIDEPVVAISVSLGCASRTTRRFVEFVDPPGVTLAQAAPAAAEATAVPQARVDATTGSAADSAPVAFQRGDHSGAVGAAARRSPSPRRTEVAAAPAVESAGAPADPGVRRAAPPTRKAPVVRQASASPRPVVAGARLQLDAPAVAVAAGPAASGPPPPAMADDTVAAAAAASAAASASAAEAQTQAALLERERRRVRSLEDAVARLEADSQAQRQALAALQIRTRGTRSERYANPFVYTLAALCLLLTMTICGLLGRRSRDRAAARWLTGPAVGEAGAAVPGEGAAGPGAPSAPLPPPSEKGSTPPSVAPVAAVSSANAAAAQDAPHASGASGASGVMAAGSPASSTAPTAHRNAAEALVDLEQQADFFIVLGQDDAAIELLRDHADAGPLPLLKLMEIHRRLGDRAEYEKVRGRVERHFNAHAPKWPVADSHRDRSLEEYPDVLARIESLWATPAAAMQALDALIFRRGPEDASFDLPAYRELMFLHSIARDRDADQAGAGAAPSRAVDLLLPIGPAPAAAPFAQRSTPAGAASRPTPAAPASMRVPIPALPGRGGVVDSTETMPSALRRAPGYANESEFVDLELEFPGLPTGHRPG